MSFRCIDSSKHPQETKYAVDEISIVSPEKLLSTPINPNHTNLGREVCIDPENKNLVRISGLYRNPETGNTYTRIEAYYLPHTEDSSEKQWSPLIENGTVNTKTRDRAHGGDYKLLRQFNHSQLPAMNTYIRDTLEKQTLETSRREEARKQATADFFQASEATLVLGVDMFFGTMLDRMQYGPVGGIAVHSFKKHAAIAVLNTSVAQTSFNLVEKYSAGAVH